MRLVVPLLRPHHQSQGQGSPWKLHLNQEGTSMSATQLAIGFQFLHSSINHEKWLRYGICLKFHCLQTPLKKNNENFTHKRVESCSINIKQEPFTVKKVQMNGKVYL